jgi:hypothetical protein
MLYCLRGAHTAGSVRHHGTHTQAQAARLATHMGASPTGDSTALMSRARAIAPDDDVEVAESPRRLYSAAAAASPLPDGSTPRHAPAVDADVEAITTLISNVGRRSLARNKYYRFRRQGAADAGSDADGVQRRGGKRRSPNPSPRDGAAEPLPSPQPVGGGSFHAQHRRATTTAVESSPASPALPSLAQASEVSATGSDRSGALTARARLNGTSTLPMPPSSPAGGLFLAAQLRSPLVRRVASRLEEVRTDENARAALEARVAEHKRPVQVRTLCDDPRWLLIRAARTSSLHLSVCVHASCCGSAARVCASDAAR